MKEFTERRAMATKSNAEYRMTCPVDKTRFEPKTPWHRYCSPKCKQIAWLKKQLKDIQGGGNGSSEGQK